MAARLGASVVAGPVVGPMVAMFSAVPWRLVSKVALLLGVAASLWAAERHVRKLVSNHDARVFASGAASRQSEIDALERTIANVRIATARAQADDKAHALKVKRAQDDVTKEENDALSQSLDATRARLAAAVAGLRRSEAGAAAASADRSRKQAQGVPAAASTASGADAAASADAVPPNLATLNECEVNTDKLVGWQAWWSRISGLGPE